MTQRRQDRVAADAATSGARRAALVAGALLLILLFGGLGTWQVYRLQWKRDLIARVDARVHAAPVAAPPAARWAQVSRESDEYRQVHLAGSFLFELTTPVQALSELGSGFWLLTPLCTTDGTIVLVNRGFVPVGPGGAARYPVHRAGSTPCRAQGDTVRMTGLLRISEPGGGFLRNNDPANNRWYSRDVQAIAAARGLRQVAPYFVDAGASQLLAGPGENGKTAPLGGLTVISFPNSHLMYAVTWYALAVMVAGAWLWVVRGQGTAAGERKDGGDN